MSLRVLLNWGLCLYKHINSKLEVLHEKTESFLVQLCHFGEQRFLEVHFPNGGQITKNMGKWWTVTLKSLLRSSYLQENKSQAPGTEFNNVPLNLARFLFGCMNICNPQIPVPIPTSWWNWNWSSRGSLIPTSTMKNITPLGITQLHHNVKQCTCKFKQIRILSDTTVRHCWDKLFAFPGQRNPAKTRVKVSPRRHGRWKLLWDAKG